jgi:isopentenyl-diphosphate delta-isomerase
MELVVLVDEQNTPIGTADKDTVHTTDTPLHRAFSLFLFNSHNQILLTKRANAKKTFPGVWTNTVCGHLSPEETPVEAATRRLAQELHIHGIKITDLAPYRYRFADNNGIVENEICPIVIGYFDGDPVPDPKEVDDWKWVNWDEFTEEIKKNPSPYSPWCREETEIVRTKLPRKDQETR